MFLVKVKCFLNNKGPGYKLNTITQVVYAFQSLLPFSKSNNIHRETHGSQSSTFKQTF